VVLVRILLVAGARTSTRSGHDAFNAACENAHVGILRLLLEYEAAKPPTKPQVIGALLDLSQYFDMKYAEGSVGAAAAVLLLHLHRLDGSAAAVLQQNAVHIVEPVALRMALLRSWATDTAVAEGKRAALVVSEQRVAAVKQGLGEMFVGFAQQQQQQQQQQQHQHQHQHIQQQQQQQQQHIQQQQQQQQQQ
jgi:hypothetical protein